MDCPYTLDLRMHMKVKFCPSSVKIFAKLKFSVGLRKCSRCKNWVKFLYLFDIRKKNPMLILIGLIIIANVSKRKKLIKRLD
jgi:hypothetical protein